MKPANPRLAATGASLVLAGILIALLVGPGALRILASLTCLAIGFGLIRQAFRLE
jgi:hypothetical protein